MATHDTIPGQPDFGSERHLAFRAREATAQPLIEKLCAQYTRGLITSDELLCEISEVILLVQTGRAERSGSIV